MADCLLFLVAKIFIQISFAPREAMTTAEPPEPLPFQHSKFIITKQFFRQIVGPAARHLYVIPLFNLQLSFSENGLYSPSEEKGKVAGSRFSVTVEVFSLPFEAGKSRRHHLERHFDSARNRNRAGEMPPLPCFAPQTVQLSGPRAAFCKMGRGQASLL